MHSQWRDCQEWQKLGLPLSTTSNEACKLYDAALSQYTGWYDDPTVGGIEATVEKMLQADPSFVMGHVVSNGLDLMGTGRSINLDPEFKVSIQNMEAFAAKNGTDWEKKHVKAVRLFADGYMTSATDIWEEILVEHPLDMLALKFAHDSYFYLGLQPQMRDSIARVMPHYKKSTPLYGYLLGMYAFGLEETNLYRPAETYARNSLEINRRDAWATHALAHVLEMEGRQDEGISFMSTTLPDWTTCGMLACHNFWHWAVYHIEKGEYQAALDIFDNECGVRANKSGAMLDIVDVCSLLLRLELEGVNVGDRWREIYEVCAAHVEDHLLCFNDAHILMTFLRAKKTDSAEKLMKTLEDYVKNGQGDNHVIAKNAGQQVCEALIKYNEGDYAGAVDVLSPVRYKILTIGGSNAQRDVFNLLLIKSALQSEKREHQKLAQQLLYERKGLKANAPMTDRLMARALACHAE